MRIQNRILAFCSALILFAAAGIHSFPAKNVHAAETVKLTPGSTYQINGGVFEGWGSSLCWWANRIGYNDTLSKKAAELFYGDSGLRLNIARFNIGGGDNPSHTHITRTDSNMPGYSVYHNGKITYDWNADANQRNVLNKILAAGGDDMIVEMFSNSPPYYMTNSGCSTGATDPKKNNLRDDQYTAFAEYLAEVCAHYQNEWGVEIQSIDPMNEPYTNYWGANSAKQEGCHFDQGNSESKMLTETKKALERHGLNNILLCGTDETSIDTAISSFNKLSADAKKALGRIDTHSYGGSKCTDLKNLALSNGKNLWMSEVDGSKTAGTNAGAMGSGLWLAERITTDCNQMNASAWILWQLIDNHVSKNGYNGRKDSGMPNLNGGFWGVAVADHDKNEIVLSKKYYSFGQYTRYIRPGMTMLNSSNTTMAAYDPQTGEIVIVAYNTGGGNRDLSFDLSGFQSVGTSAQGIRTSASENWKDIGKTNLSGKILNVTLPANSIATYIIGGTGETTDRTDKIDLSKAVLSGTDSWHSESSTDYTKAFDGSTATYFDGVGGGSVQADLGAVYDFTQIGYCPRAGHEARCVDAFIQISDDGLNWKTVYTVTELPGGGMHYVKPENASGRYVRYAVPEGAPQNPYNKDDVYCCNIAEIELYGSKAGKYIRSLSVYDTANAAAWSVVTEPKQTGNAVFGDRAFRFTSVPQTLDGAEWIQTACDSKKYAGNEAVFTAGTDISAYVALDNRITDVPAWLSGWTKTTDTLTDDGNPQVTYQLYKKDFNAGETVTLGEVNQSGCVNYAVAATAQQTVPVTGDINTDGVCDKTDLVMLRDYLLTVGTLTPEQGAIADLNADGKLNAIDLTLLKRILIKA